MSSLLITQKLVISLPPGFEIFPLQLIFSFNFTFFHFETQNKPEVTRAGTNHKMVEEQSSKMVTGSLAECPEALAEFLEQFFMQCFAAALCQLSEKMQFCSSVVIYCTQSIVWDVFIHDWLGIQSQCGQETCILQEGDLVFTRTHKRIPFKNRTLFISIFESFLFICGKIYEFYFIVY